METTLTAVRFGKEFAPWAVGYQLAGATFSVAAFPPIVGFLVNTRGPLVIAPILVIVCALLVVTVEALRIMTAFDSRSRATPVA